MCTPTRPLKNQEWKRQSQEMFCPVICLYRYDHSVSDSEDPNIGIGIFFNAFNYSYTIVSSLALIRHEVCATQSADKILHFSLLH